MDNEYTEYSPLASTGNAVIDLFFQAVRGVDGDKLAHLVDAAWAADALMTLKLLFHRRDVRGGLGERRVFTEAIQRVAVLAPATVERNLVLFPFYGRWDDLCVFYLDAAHADTVFDLFFQQLNIDKVALTASTPSEPPSVSLCAKWFPSENSLRFPHFANRFCRKFKMTKRELRVTYLTPLRKHLEIVETFLCKKTLQLVNFDRVPSRAMLMYRNVFAQTDGYQAYIRKKTTKAKARCIDPHEIVRALLTPGGDAAKAILEAQWAAKQAEIAPGKNVLCVCDLSQSMDGLPRQVCISLGLLISSRADPVFKDLVVTFSSTPAFRKITGDTLAARVQSMVGCDIASGSTSLVAVFDLVLERMTAHGLAQADLPEKIVILSDVFSINVDAV